MTDYQELKRLAEAATPGPWKVKDRKVVTTEDAAICCSPVFRIGAYKQSMANTEYFAAASPDVVLGLLAEIEQLQRDFTYIKQQRDKLQDEVKNTRTNYSEGWDECIGQRDTLCTQNQALVEAVKAVIDYDESDPDDSITLMLNYADALAKCRAAQAEGGV